MTDPVPDRLALHARGTREQPENRPPPRHRPGQRFLKGPIPLSWLTAAADQPGKALHVGVVLWFLAGLDSRREVRLSGSVARRFGLNRHAVYRGLAALESVRLVSVVRHAGRNPLVTLLDAADTL